MLWNNKANSGMALGQQDGGFAFAGGMRLCFFECDG